jgi:hypothetical protein
MTRLRAELPIEGLDHLILLGDEDAETKIDIALGRLEKPKTLTRDEMIELVRNIFNPQGFSEARIDLMVAQFIFNCKHPAGSDLIFWPSGHFPDDRDPRQNRSLIRQYRKTDDLAGRTHRRGGSPSPKNKRLPNHPFAPFGTTAPLGAAPRVGSPHSPHPPRWRRSRNDSHVCQEE